MPNSLVEFWSKCECKSAPFVHPADLPYLNQNKRWLIEKDAADFESYVHGERFGVSKDSRIHLSLYPVPYLGNLDTADIVILLLNPGFEYSDYWGEYKVPNFRSRLEQTLRQNFKEVEFPFWPLDPTLCWHTGFIWWEKKLRDVITAVAKHRHEGRYLAALKEVSQKIACIELLPYHSVSFQDHKLIDLLPSVKAAKQFVESTLLPDTKSGRRTVIATRQIKGWGLKGQNNENLVLYEGGHTRGASLGVNSEGGKAILKRFGVS